jgi:hypothetical protein
MDDLECLIEERSSRCIDVATRRTPSADTTPINNREASITDSQYVRSEHHAATKLSQKDIRFRGIITALCFASLLGGLETTIVTTSLPTTVHGLNIGEDYVWITNFLFLTR